MYGIVYLSHFSTNQLQNGVTFVIQVIRDKQCEMDVCLKMLYLFGGTHSYATSKLQNGGKGAICGNKIKIKLQ